jgi:hypothetical protein
MGGSMELLKSLAFRILPSFSIYSAWAFEKIHPRMKYTTLFFTTIFAP